ncbi:hypothetical protein MRX96_018338 [Rhipicephalus microplus]
MRLPGSETTTTIRLDAQVRASRPVLSGGLMVGATNAAAGGAFFELVEARKRAEPKKRKETAAAAARSAGCKAQATRNARRGKVWTPRGRGWPSRREPRPAVTRKATDRWPEEGALRRSLENTPRRRRPGRAEGAGNGTVKTRRFEL